MTRFGMDAARDRLSPAAVDIRHAFARLSDESTLTLAWCVLAAASLTAILAVPFVPRYDYVQWVYQGRIVSDLFVGRPDAAGSVSGFYSLSHHPVPNSAAPFGIAAFSVIMPPEAAGEVFLAFSVLLFAFGFAFLLRSVQGRPTAVELLGFAVATGYFLYKGYVSYLVSLAVLFVGIGLLQRMLVRQSPLRARLSVKHVAALTALASLIFLCHLVGWLIFAAAAFAYTVPLLTRREWRPALSVYVALVPGAVMLATYLIVRAQARTTYYPHLLLSRDKLISLIEPFMLFLRPDPFAPLVPAFWANAGALALIGGVLWVNVDWRIASRPLVAVGASLFGVALLLPVSSAGDLIRPDERLIFPAALLALAGLRLRRLTPFRCASGACAVLAIISLHFAEDLHLGRTTERIEAVSTSSIPSDASIYAVTLHSGTVSGGCNGTYRDGPSFGVPVMKWFALDQLAEGPPRHVSLADTSLVHEKGAGAPPEVFMTTLTPEEVRARGRLGTALATTGYRYVEAFGCEADLTSLDASLSPEYETVTAGDGYRVFKLSSAAIAVAH